MFCCFSVTLVAQKSFPDTLSCTDTIPARFNMLKGTGDFTLKTEVDTVITLVINELLAINSDLFVDDAGDDEDWFEIYNYGDDPVRLNSLFFTDDPALPFKWKLDASEELMLDQNKHLIIWADDETEEGYNHASFKLSGEGEYLGIYAGDGTLVDQVFYGPQHSNFSYGRFPDAGLSWNFFDVPTPSAPNSEPGEEEVLPVPFSNLTGGFYTDPVMMALYTTIAGSTIYYTTDCTEPDTSDLLYRGPFEISSTTIIRARAFKENAVGSPVLTISVLMEEQEFDNPVISLVAEPDVLFGETGLISEKNSVIEVTASMEYIEDGEALFRSSTGVQLHAPKSSAPNSLSLSARTRYGNSWFDYPFFKNRGPDKFKELILRNSGNDDVNKATTNIHFRDPLIQTLARKSNKNPMISESKPVNVFLNGNYYSLFNLREKEDEYYIETHTGVTEDYDFIELEFDYYANIHILEGSYDSWRELLAFVDTTGNLSLDEDFRILEQMVDLENFTDYWITEVFVGNYDWISNNILFWKPENGQWKWIYWDTDHGLGLKFINYGDASWNTLLWSLTFSDRAWSNGYNNILIRNLLLNENYRAFFIKRFAQLLSTSFSFNNTKPVLDSMIALYRNDMTIHADHWGRSMSNWENACSIVEDYLRRRPDTVFNHIRDFFGLQDPVPVSIRVEPPGAGTISFSGLKVSDRPMHGKFFPGMEYQLQFKILPGFTIDKCEPFNVTGDSIEFQLTDSMEIVAYCLPSDHSFPIQLSEVYSNNHESYDAGDWIEFYYYGSNIVNLNNWYITGDDDQLLYSFGEEAIVNPGESFVVAEDLERFGEIFKEPLLIFGNLNHGFTNQTTLTLKSGEGETLIRVELMASPDWPELPEEGFSIELKSIADDAGNGANWELSENSFGSPGRPNYTCYNFHKPSGKDSIFNNSEIHHIGITSPGEFYSDQDHHLLAGISIKEITGPGELYLDNVRLDPGNVYDPADLEFHPHEPLSSATNLTYSFIDKSGQESPDYSIWFNPTLGISHVSRQSLRVYPVPSRDFCIIELPPAYPDPVDFILFDINGKRLKSLHFPGGNRELNIDLTGVGSGIYIYLIKTDQSVINGKIQVIR